jgi:hypothetical protein
MQGHSYCCYQAKHEPYQCPDRSRIVGNPSLTGLWKGCPSSGRNHGVSPEHGGGSHSNIPVWIRSF